MAETFVLGAIINAFESEIANDFEVKDNKIIVTLADGNKAVIKTKKCSQ